MDEPHKSPGRLWILFPEDRPDPDMTQDEPEPAIHRTLSLAAERWIGITAIVAMIGLSDLLMAHYWH